MAGQRGELVGRREHLAALRWDGREPAVRLVLGEPGSGRSAVLVAAGSALRKAGVPVLAVSAGDRAADPLGVGALLAALRAETATAGPVADTLASVARLAAAGPPALPWQRHVLLSAIGSLFARVRALTPVAVLVDDAHLIADPVPALTAVHRAGHLVVASCPPGTARGLRAAADQVVDLAPLDDAATASLVRRAAGGPVDPGVAEVLRRDLGPLYGNPAAVLAAVADLRGRGRLAKVHGVLVLRDPHQPVALHEGRWPAALVERYGQAGRELVALADDHVGVAIGDLPALAAVTGGSVVDYGAAADALVTAGVLRVDGRGTLRCAVPAVSGTADTLRGALACELVKRGDRERAADHAVAAGTAATPQPDLSAPLARTAGDDPRVSQAAWWHTPPGPDRDRLRSEVVALLLRAGDYRALAAFTTTAVSAAGTDLDHEGAAVLARAAALASVHTGQPVPGPVAAALTAAGVAAAPLEFARDWHAGVPVDPARVAASFAEPAGTVDDEAATAFSCRNPVPALRAALGSRYGAPLDGPAHWHHRALTAYAAGDWTTAVGAVRRLELDGADIDALVVARLVAAEVSSWRGEDRQASAWLAGVPVDGPFPLGRAWVVCGLSRDDPARAFAAGWGAYRRHAGSGDEPGGSRLLRRLAVLAPDAACSAAVAEAAAERGSGTACLRETLLLATGLRDRNPLPLRVAERLARRRGDRFDQAVACLTLAETGDQSRPWADAALAAAKALGVRWISTRAKRVLEDSGVPVPRARRAVVTEVEQRIVELVREGKTNRQIAATVHISVTTVEKHITRLLARTGCRSRHGLATSPVTGASRPA
ncbi:LuxR C-terminal-related transcriptional regulator [Actinokineospora sp. 24-640]